VAQILEGQKIIFILQNTEDIILLRERLKVIKDVDFLEYKSIEQIDIEEEIKKINNSHIMLFMDDLCQI
jgi:hypothetical protein